MAYSETDAFEHAKMKASQGLQQAASNACVGRELTVGELLDRRIDKAERLLKALHDLKGALSGNFLNSGASRISAFLEL